jgi:hypothetical protein
VSFDVLFEERPEEWETLNVVHVEMAEEYVDTIVSSDVVAQLTDPASCVEDDEVALGCDQLD